MLYVFNSLNEPSCFQTNIGFYKITVLVSPDKRGACFDTWHELHSYWVKLIISYTKKMKVGIILTFCISCRKKYFVTEITS